MNEEKFLKACQKIVNHHREKNKIGTLGEKTLHAVLKNYFESDETKQEIRVGSYYADIFDGEEIIEIQTRQFNKLREKLSVFLKEYPVTIVYPVPGEKHLYWLDQESGELSRGRLSPKKGTPYEICAELYKIKNYLRNPNLHFHILILEVDEYRFLNGWSKDRKRGSSRCDRIPRRINSELCITDRSDYRKLLPGGLPERFGSKEFAKSAHISRRLAQITLHILLETKTVQRVGKSGNAWIYQMEKI